MMIIQQSPITNHEITPCAENFVTFQDFMLEKKEWLACDPIVSCNCTESLPSVSTGHCSFQAAWCVLSQWHELAPQKGRVSSTNKATKTPSRWFFLVPRVFQASKYKHMWKIIKFKSNMSQLQISFLSSNSSSHSLGHCLSCQSPDTRCGMWWEHFTTAKHTYIYKTIDWCHYTFFSINRGIHAYRYVLYGKYMTSQLDVFFCIQLCYSEVNSKTTNWNSAGLHLGGHSEAFEAAKTLT